MPQERTLYPSCWGAPSAPPRGDNFPTRRRAVLPSRGAYSAAPSDRPASAVFSGAGEAGRAARISRGGRRCRRASASPAGSAMRRAGRWRGRSRRGRGTASVASRGSLNGPSAGDAASQRWPSGRPWPSPPTIHVVPGPRTGPATRARLCAPRPVFPQPADVASTSWGRGSVWAGLSTGRRSVTSTACLHRRSDGGGGWHHPKAKRGARGIRARFFPPAHPCVLRCLWPYHASGQWPMTP